MTETTNTAARSTRADPRYISMYLVCDAALNIHNRPNRHLAAAASPRLPRKRRSELGDSLLRTALVHQTDTAPVDWQIGRAANGGPVIRQGPHAQSARRAPRRPVAGLPPADDAPIIFGSASLQIMWRRPTSGCSW